MDKKEVVYENMGTMIHLRKRQVNVCVIPDVSSYVESGDRRALELSSSHLEQDQIFDDDSTVMVERGKELLYDRCCEYRKC